MGEPYISKTKTYWVWHNMKHRCSDQNHPSWANYGARGITVCDRWLESVYNFITDMGERPDGYFLDRVDNHKGYSKENCRWVTRKENCRNKRNNRYITHSGETLTLIEWQERTGIRWNTIRRRLDVGWSVEDSLTRPVIKQVKMSREAYNQKQKLYRLKRAAEGNPILRKKPN